MGFPTRACMELTSEDAMKQSLRLVKDVSLSMSWNAESLPVKRGHGVIILIQSKHVPVRLEIAHIYSITTKNKTNKMIYLLLFKREKKQ